MRTRITLVIAVAAVTAACSNKEAAARGPASEVEQAGTTAPAVVTVHAHDYAFDAPDTVAAGVTTFHLINDGPGLHHVQLARLDGGKTVADVMAALKHPGKRPAWLVLVGGPNAPAPHASSDAIVDLQPGNYALLCMVDIPEGVPHMAKGMIHALTVTPSASDAVTPAPDVAITLVDYGFSLSRPLTAGSHVVAISNTATQPHEVEFVRLEPGKTATEMLAWLQKMQGPPPGTPIGGGAAIAPGGHEEVRIDLTPGHYALICFLKDAKDGQPHFVHGMVHDITVS